jgi:hypothetical protein
MLFVADARGEVNGVRVAPIAAVAVDERPKKVILNRLAVRPAQLADESAGLAVEDVDGAVAEVADQQVAREFPEAGGRDLEALRRVQRPL